MSEFDGKVVQALSIPDKNSDPERAEFGKKTLQRRKEEELSIVGDMVVVREIVQRIDSSPDLQNLAKTNGHMLNDRFFECVLDWHAENKLEGAGVAIRSGLLEFGTIRGNRRIRADGTNLLGRFGIVVDFTIQKSRIVEERIVLLASPEAAWESAHNDLLSIYEAKAKVLAEKQKIKAITASSRTVIANLQTRKGNRVTHALNTGLRTIMKGIDAGKATG